VSIFVKIQILDSLVPLSTVAICGYFFIAALPQFQKKVRIIMLLGLLFLSSISSFLYFLIDQKYFLIISLAIRVSFYLLLYLVLFDRIVSVMQTVSISNVLDGLTNLFNKKYFLTKLKESMTTGNRPTVFFLDIDNFKRLNDSQGHAVGDQILKLCGQIMREEFENIGYAARYGGEELVALITDSNSISPETVAERIRKRIVSESEEIYSVTVSIGYKTFSDEESPEKFLEKADYAMYASKFTGKNKYVNYDDPKYKEIINELQNNKSLDTVPQSNPSVHLVDENPDHSIKILDSEGLEKPNYTEQAISLNNEETSDQVAQNSIGVRKRKNPFAINKD
jgi:two-component system, cell cycle response regulator